MTKSPLAPYLEMTKPRILTLVLVTTVLGYALGRLEGQPLLDGIFCLTLLGTGLAAGGASVLNHFAERDVDALMHRTRNRPLPRGLVAPWVALAYGVVLIGAGTLLLWLTVNGVSAALALATALLYVLVYTPMKRFSWMNTPVGAVPGAIPPMIGWAAATGGHLEEGAWILFFILFLWQHPHFYAIAWMFKDDYRRGGFKMLPVVQPDGKNTFRQSLASAVILIPVSLCLTFFRTTGWIYFGGALLCGAWYLLACIRWRMSEFTLDARKVLRASIIYLPAMLLFIIIDSFFN